MDPVFVLSDTSVYVSGWAELYGVTGTIKLDYGLSTAYGEATTQVVIGPPSFSFIINALTPGTQYHYRAEITSSRGVKRSPDVSFTLPAAVTSFDFSPHVGEIWRYHFVSRLYSFREGIHTWRIVSSDGNGNYTCMETTRDSLSSYVPLLIDSTSFMIHAFQDYFQVDFPEYQSIGSTNVKWIPKFFDAAQDTYSFSMDYVIGVGVGGFERATYVRGIGLVRYTASQPHMNGTDAYLDLLEHKSP
jgi:hypothetical protein